jgi:hypothetical protein
MSATEEVIAKRGIGVGEEVFITGLFVNHAGRKRNLPIVRAGNIAQMPEEPVYVGERFGDMEAYLVESRSVGGLSGSPVFAYLDPSRQHTDISTGKSFLRIGGGPRYYLLGLMHGHFEVDSPNEGLGRLPNSEKINMGVAIVVPVSKILEVINLPELEKEREDFERQIKSGVTVAMDTAEPSNESDFMDDLKKASRRKDD